MILLYKTKFFGLISSNGDKVTVVELASVIEANWWTLDVGVTLSEAVFVVVTWLLVVMTPGTFGTSVSDDLSAFGGEEVTMVAKISGETEVSGISVFPSVGFGGIIRDVVGMLPLPTFVGWEIEVVDVIVVVIGVLMAGILIVGVLTKDASKPGGLILEDEDVGATSTRGTPGSVATVEAAEVIVGSNGIVESRIGISVVSGFKIYGPVVVTKIYGTLSGVLTGGTSTDVTDIVFDMSVNGVVLFQ